MVESLPNSSEWIVQPAHIVETSINKKSHSYIAYKWGGQKSPWLSITEQNTANLLKYINLKTNVIYVDLWASQSNRISNVNLHFNPHSYPQ